MKTDWLQPQKTMTLSAGDVHVWCFSMGTPLDAKRLSCLSPEECARAARFSHALAKKQYQYSHAVLRDILSRYLQCDPCKIGYRFGEHGKPYLLNDELQFSMSHSEGVVYFAVAQSHNIGIDVEFVKRQVDWQALSKRFFCEEEHQAMMALPAQERCLAFYRCWTRKEAFLKATGNGIANGLQRCLVSLANQGVNLLYSVDGQRALASDWSLVSLCAFGSDYVAALAWHHPLNKITYWCWQPQI